MTTKEKIVALMQFKKGKLDTAGSPHDYFTTTDETNLNTILNGMTNNEIEDVWTIITNRINYDVAGLSAFVCPFCLIPDLQEFAKGIGFSCNVCIYGEEHGICVESGSHYRAIISALDVITVITNQNYKDFLAGL